jgi:hypothetical protein
MYLAPVAVFCESGSIEFRNFLTATVSFPVYSGQTHAHVVKSDQCLNYFSVFFLGK